jgi:gluconate:H+ symporter, GntP family
MDLNPLVILAIGVAIVLSLILVLRINAFIALITAAFTVSLIADGDVTEKISRVGTAFGGIVGAIGIVIALAAVIGRALMDSGAAERIVLSLMRLFGEKRAKFALMGSGFVLSVPVFFDTVFYLLVPLARGLFRKTKQNYLLYITAIVAGGAVTHTMVPPTPGPLFMANELKIDLTAMIWVGCLVAIPMSVAGVYVCGFLNSRLDIPMRPVAGVPEPEPMDESSLPPLWLSLVPVFLPVLLITLRTTTNAMIEGGNESAAVASLASISAVLGNPSFALLLSAAVAVFMVSKWKKRSLVELSADAEQSLMSAGLVILITAAGGAFGAMLREAGIQAAVGDLVGEESGIAGIAVLVVAAMVASLVKFAQGSGTVAMITTSTIFAGIGFTTESLGFNVVYLACAIGSGSLIGDWMNNSGFWIFAKMSGLTEQETLKSWTVLTAVMGLVGLVVTVLLASVLPLLPASA